MRQILESLARRYYRSRLFMWVSMCLLSIIALCRISSFIWLIGISLGFIRLRRIGLSFIRLRGICWSFISLRRIIWSFISLRRIFWSFVSSGLIVGWLKSLFWSIRLGVVCLLGVRGSWSFIGLLNFIRSIVCMTISLLTVRLRAIALRFTIWLWLNSRCLSSQWCLAIGLRLGIGLRLSICL